MPHDLLIVVTCFSYLLAYEPVSYTHLDVYKRQLIRIVDTESQTQKSRSERAENMKDVFALTDSKSLKGKHILVLDDVLTTGATLESCVATLQEIEGITISIATIGIAMD